MRTLLALALAAALPAAAQEPRPTPAEPAAPAAAAPAKPPDAGIAPEPPPVKAAAVLEEVTGTVAAMDRKAQRVEIATAGGPVRLKLDRNTLVYTQAGLGTALDIQAGQPIRAGRNAAFTAYWILVRPSQAPAPGAPAAAPSTPAQGTGPGGGAGPATGDGGGTAPPASPPGSGPTGTTTPGAP